MSPQDSQLLQDFLNQLVQARGVVKDPEAEALINRAVSQQPDAAYLLVQRALLQQQALNNAKAEIAALQDQLRAGAQSRPAFLDPNSWGNNGTARPAAAAQPVPPAAAPYQQPYQPQYQQPYPGAVQAQAPGGAGGFLRSGMGSMLGTAAATAAGVAGGAFLFQGLENLLGHRAGNGFLGPQSALTSPNETTTINNYYGSDESANKSMADKLGGDSLFDSGNNSANSLFDASNDSRDSLSDDLADNIDSGIDDIGQDDDLFT
jgi:hypothetical protein